MNWDQYYRIVGNAVGVEPKLVHVASDFISALMPEHTGSLIGDKAVSVVFDNTKIKCFVPDFRATTRFTEGIRESLAWFDADPNRKQIDQEANAAWDKLIRLYERGLDAAQKDFCEACPKYD